MCFAANCDRSSDMATAAALACSSASTTAAGEATSIPFATDPTCMIDTLRQVFPGVSENRLETLRGMFTAAGFGTTRTFNLIPTCLQLVISDMPQLLTAEKCALTLWVGQSIPMNPKRQRAPTQSYGDVWRTMLEYSTDSHGKIMVNIRKFAAYKALTPNGYRESFYNTIKRYTQELASAMPTYDWWADKRLMVSQHAHLTQSAVHVTGHINPIDVCCLSHRPVRDNWSCNSRQVKSSPNNHLISSTR